MALYVLQPGVQPLGQFDFLDTDLDNVLGGEVGTWDEASRTNSASEKAAADVLDGYVADQIDVGTPTASRPVMRLADSSATDDSKAFYLLDDGKVGYGTMFGSVIGVPVGLSMTGTNLGPSTAAASGKVTLWDKPGLYAVSLDAVHSSAVVPDGGLAAGLDTPLPGDLLYRHQSNAKMARAATAGGTIANNKVALFVEMSANGSLVTTPARLVGAAETFDRIVVQYLGATFNL